MDVENFVVKESDMAGKGVSVQPNPMELPEAEAKAVFDQLVKEVVVPFFNKFVEAFANVDLTSDADKPISTATQEALDKKVDKAYKTGSQSEYKVLSDNNFTDNSKENLALATRDRHTHDNKSLLDKFTQDFVNNILFKDNEEPYEPSGPYNPATQKYVDDKVVAIGAADMTKAVYDKQNRQMDIFDYADKASLLYDAGADQWYKFEIRNGGLWVVPVEAPAVTAAEEEKAKDGEA